MNDFLIVGVPDVISHRPAALHTYWLRFMICNAVLVGFFGKAMEELDPEEQFLRDARNGNLEGIQRLLMSKIKEEAKIDINCKGRTRH